MKKYNLFLVLGVLSLVVFQSSAAMLFKMELADPADDTCLNVGEQVEINLYAFADVAEATGTNGLNSWSMYLKSSNDGVLSVVDGSINFIAPSPYSTYPLDTGYAAINAGNSGDIDDLHLTAEMPPQDSETGVGGYSLIAEFTVEAVGLGATEYAIQDDGIGSGFNGILRDNNPMLFDQIFTGTFDAANSDRCFTVVPEPSTLTILAILSISAFKSRKR